MRTSGEDVGADSPWQRGVVGRFEEEAPAAPVGCCMCGQEPRAEDAKSTKESKTKPTHNKKRREVEATIYWIIQSPNKVLSVGARVSTRTVSQSRERFRRPGMPFSSPDF